MFKIFNFSFNYRLINFIQKSKISQEQKLDKRQFSQIVQHLKKLENEMEVKLILDRLENNQLNIHKYHDKSIDLLIQILNNLCQRNNDQFGIKQKKSFLEILFKISVKNQERSPKYVIPLISFCNNFEQNHQKILNMIKSYEQKQNLNIKDLDNIFTYLRKRKLIQVENSNHINEISQGFLTQVLNVFQGQIDDDQMFHKINLIYNSAFLGIDDHRSWHIFEQYFNSRLNQLEVNQFEMILRVFSMKQKGSQKFYDFSYQQFADFLISKRLTPLQFCLMLRSFSTIEKINPQKNFKQQPDLIKEIQLFIENNSFQENNLVQLLSSLTIMQSISQEFLQKITSQILIKYQNLSILNMINLGYCNVVYDNFDNKDFWQKFMKLICNSSTIIMNLEDKNKFQLCLILTSLIINQHKMYLCDSSNLFQQLIQYKIQLTSYLQINFLLKKQNEQNLTLKPQKYKQVIDILQLFYAIQNYIKIQHNIPIQIVQEYVLDCFNIDIMIENLQIWQLNEIINQNVNLWIYAQDISQTSYIQKNDPKFFIEIHGPYHYQGPDDSILNASSKLKQNIIEKMDIKLIVISYTELQLIITKNSPNIEFLKLIIQKLNAIKYI